MENNIDEVNIFANCKNTKEQGNIGLGEAIRYFTSKRMTVSLPLNDSQDYDLVVEDCDGNLKKVQVKITNYKHRRYFTVNLKVSGGNSKKNYVHKINTEINYDWLFVLCANGDEYIIEKEIIKNLKNEISLNSYGKFKIN